MTKQNNVKSNGATTKKLIYLAEWLIPFMPVTRYVDG